MSDVKKVTEFQKDLTAQLGKDWTPEPTEFDHWARLVHKSGLKLNIRTHWNKKDKHCFGISSPLDQSDRCTSWREWGFPELEGSVNISNAKPIDRIAKELNTRLLTAGVPAYIAAMNKRAELADELDIKCKLFNYSCDLFNIEWNKNKDYQFKASGYGPRHIYFKLEQSSSGTRLEIDYLDNNELEQISDLIKTFKKRIED